MKYYLYLFVVLIACKASKSNRVEGIYTCYYEHEFAQVYDTLIVKKVNGGRDIYQIERRSGIIRKWDSRLLPKEISEELFVVDYDADKQTLNQKYGRILFWNSEQNVLILGKQEYKKT